MKHCFIYTLKIINFLVFSLDKANKENAKFESDLNMLENRYAELQPKYNKVVAELKKIQDELKDFDKIKKQLETTKKHLENETLNRVDLENKIQSLKVRYLFLLPIIFPISILGGFEF